MKHIRLADALFLKNETMKTAFTNLSSYIITLVSVFTLSLSADSQVVINEYSCSNMNGITDAFGDTEDWVEIYNTTGTSVDITGWYLSDKASNLTKWQVPSGSVPANGFLTVMCSGRNTVQGGELHPNFNLKAGSF